MPRLQHKSLRDIKKQIRGNNDNWKEY
ncbi:hypothetical protein LCGC14_1953050, partial [marine sediment metagenome]